MKRYLIDLRPIRESSQFRKMFSSQLVSNFGDQLSAVGVAYEVYHITGSSFQVGAVSVAQLLPLALVSIFGGGLVDHLDRRKLMLGGYLLSGLLSIGTVVDISRAKVILWPLYLFPALIAGASSLVRASQNATVTGIVGDHLITAAAALRQLMFQIGAITGPAIAGIIIAKGGVSLAFFIDTASFFVGLAITLVLKPLPPEQSNSQRRTRLKDGYSAVKASHSLLGIYTVDLIAMVFGMPRALFPALAIHQFHGGPALLGYMYAALGGGSMVAALSSGWLASIGRLGLSIEINVCVWGLAIALFGITHQIALALMMLALAGYSDVNSAILRNSLLQYSAPKETLGRLNAVQILVVTGGPRLGDLESGIAGSIGGTTFAVVSGGIACIVFTAFLAMRLTGFTKYDVSGRRPIDPN
ncbi:MAG: MFS transporter [Actinomycetota bacterium]|nr:MFS transporter [Actinomycetota bacterium]